jgi:hypothetical protein
MPEGCFEPLPLWVVFHLLVALHETQSLNVKFISKYPSQSGPTHKHIVKHIPEPVPAHCGVQLRNSTQTHRETYRGPGRHAPHS